MLVTTVLDIVKDYKHTFYRKTYSSRIFNRSVSISLVTTTRKDANNFYVNKFEFYKIRFKFNNILIYNFIIYLLLISIDRRAIYLCMYLSIDFFTDKQRQQFYLNSDYFKNYYNLLIILHYLFFHIMVSMVIVFSTNKRRSL